MTLTHRERGTISFDVPIGMNHTATDGMSPTLPHLRRPLPLKFNQPPDKEA